MFDQIGKNHGLNFFWSGHFVVIPYQKPDKDLVRELETFFNEWSESYTLSSYYVPGENKQSLCFIEHHRKDDNGQWIESGCICAAVFWRRDFSPVKLHNFLGELGAKYEIDRFMIHKLPEAAVLTPYNAAAESKELFPKPPDASEAVVPAPAEEKTESERLAEIQRLSRGAFGT
ncbi:MAG: hypothetical protein V1928_01255 [Parcubacteria group bacterium]